MGLIGNENETDALVERMALSTQDISISSPIKAYYKRLYYKQTIHSIYPNSQKDTDTMEIQYQIEHRIGDICKNVLSYESPDMKRQAREAIDLPRIKQRAAEFLTEKPDAAPDVAFLEGLLRWFKFDFFKWVNTPACEAIGCGANPGAMERMGGGPPTQEELHGLPGMVEIYRCRQCSQITRFPRYNNPATLLRTRRGRCGEWANAFCLICRALSLDARYVLDWTDHVWVEVWVESLKRFVHADSCERKMDAPLMYEGGWGKKLSFIFSISRYGVVDTIHRYTRKFPEVLKRRIPARESDVQIIIKKFDDMLYGQYINSHILSNNNFNNFEIKLQNPLELSMIDFHDLGSMDFNVSTVIKRRRLLQRELEALLLLADHEWKLDELQGRISGSSDWKAARGEDGSLVDNRLYIIGKAMLNDNPNNNINNNQSNNLLSTEMKLENKNITTTVQKSQLIEMNNVLNWLIPNIMMSSTALRCGYLDLRLFSTSSSVSSDVGGTKTKKTHIGYMTAGLCGLHSGLGSNEFPPTSGSSIHVAGVPLAAANHGLHILALDAVTGTAVRSVTVEGVLGNDSVSKEEIVSAHEGTHVHEEESNTMTLYNNVINAYVIKNSPMSPNNEIVDGQTDDAKSIDTDNRMEVKSPSQPHTILVVTHTDTDMDSRTKYQLLSFTDINEKAEKKDDEKKLSLVIMKDVDGSNIFIHESKGDSNINMNNNNDKYSYVFSRVRLKLLGMNRFQSVESIGFEERKEEVSDTRMTRSHQNQASDLYHSFKDDIRLVKVEGYICDTPMKYLSSTDFSNAKYANINAKAEALCLSNSLYLGYIVTSTGDILLFGDAGYPLRKQTGCCAYLKSCPWTSENTAIQTSSPPDVIVAAKYLSLDKLSNVLPAETNAFDCTQFLWSFLDSLLSGAGLESNREICVRRLWSQLRLTEVRFWSSECINVSFV